MSKPNDSHQRPPAWFQSSFKQAQKQADQLHFVSISGNYATSGNTHTHMLVILAPCKDKFGLDEKIFVRNTKR